MFKLMVILVSLLLSGQSAAYDLNLEPPSTAAALAFHADFTLDERRMFEPTEAEADAFEAIHGSAPFGWHYACFDHDGDGADEIGNFVSDDQGVVSFQEGLAVYSQFQASSGNSVGPTVEYYCGWLSLNHNDIIAAVSEDTGETVAFAKDEGTGQWSCVVESTKERSEVSSDPYFAAIDCAEKAEDASIGVGAGGGTAPTIGPWSKIPPRMKLVSLFGINFANP